MTDLRSAVFDFVALVEQTVQEFELQAVTAASVDTAVCSKVALGFEWRSLKKQVETHTTETDDEDFLDNLNRELEESARKQIEAEAASKVEGAVTKRLSSKKSIGRAWKEPQEEVAKAEPASSSTRKTKAPPRRAQSDPTDAKRLKKDHMIQERELKKYLKTHTAGSSDEGI